MIRLNPITGDPVLVAPARAERPNVYRGDAECPFCPGRETETPPEIARDGDPWRIRVFPNKYPATEHHEVIVESANHDATFASLDPDDAERAVRMYDARHRALASRPGVRHVCVFKNHGAAAGASIPHIHSQVVGTPFVPPRIAREIEGFTRASACPLCAMPGDVLEETEHFVRIAPEAAIVADEQWIIPRLHVNEFTAFPCLGPLLQRAAAFDAFNWIVMTFRDTPRAHWYVQVLPRSAVFAGFELGTGSAINAASSRRS